jgi:ADP-ribose pyrophosphatase YjhB (NUDIX family)
MNSPNAQRWTPRVTVAAVVERDGRFLVVEEHTPDGLRINQPAGHLEAGETLIDAVKRETLEETAHAFVPTALVGVYMAHLNGATYVRFTFCGEAALERVSRELDTGIVRAVWMSADELRACSAQHRSPLVLRSLEDYLAGRRIALDFVHTDSVGPRQSE